MDRYEHQIQRYSGLSRNKDLSILREEAGKLYEARKDYIQKSMQHIQMIAEFRNQLANLLVERMLTASVKLDDIGETVEIWRYLKTALTNWKKWLIDVSLSQTSFKQFRLNPHNHRIDKHVRMK